MLARPGERETVARLSTAPRQTVERFPPHDAPSIQEIDRRRRAAGIAVKDLLAEAGMRSNTWYDARKPHATMRPGTRARLFDALRRLADRTGKKARANALLPLIRAIEYMLRTEILMARLAGAEAAPERLRAFAIYIAAVEVEVENAQLARALGCTRQHIKQTRMKVDDLREAAPVDALLDRVAAQLKVEP